MDHLGLTGPQLRDYHALLASPHDFDIEVDVLTMEEQRVSSIKVLTSRGNEVGFLDGQVNIQREGHVKRTATFTLFDPDRSLHLDPDSPFAGAVFANRMIRYTHIVDLPGVGDVRAVPFVGPITGAGREGDVLTLTTHDKTVLAIEGCQPKTVKKGKNAVDAIHDIMADCTGERRFRFPKNHKARLTRSYSVGWKPEASPWVVCQKIAASINMQLIYSCDGYLVLRRRPKNPVLRIAQGGLLTGAPRTEYDISGVRNHVRVSGRRNKAKKVTIHAVAEPPKTHPFSPHNASFSRHGVPRYLPTLIDDSNIKKESVAKKRAENELDRSLPMGVQASFPNVPVFHLDYGDIVKVVSDFGNAEVPFISGSIPLGLGSDMTTGTQKVVSRPRRNF